ncbi:MAG: hypothetical protein ACR2FY_09205 [Pirellulaceae bacterium]
MSFRQYLCLGLLLTAIGSIGEVIAQDKENAKNAKDCLDDFFLNGDALTSNSCELVSGSVTTSDSSRVFPLDFVWFRAQKVEGRKKTRSYVEGRTFDLKNGPEGAYMERKLIVGEEGFYGMGVNPPLQPMDVTSGGLPEDEFEAYLVKQDRLRRSQYNFPEICPATLMAAADLNPPQGTLGKAHSLYRRMKLIDEYTKESLTIGTWRLDGKNLPGWLCARIMFDRKQGHMPTFVEWRRRNTNSDSDPNSPASYTTVINLAETKWTQFATKEKKLWAPVRVVNKRVGPTSQEWFIESTWRLDVLKDEYFDAEKINGDGDQHPLAKLRRQMQNAADKANANQPDKAKKGDKTKTGDN